MTDLTRLLINIDPLNRHTDSFTLDDMVHLLGYIPEFVIAALDQPDSLLHEAMLHAYGFPVAPMLGGALTEEGVYTYHQDPDLAPLATLKTKRGLVHVYLYGITAICETGQPAIVYRFD